MMSTNKHTARIENHLQKLEMLHDLIGREIAETRAALAEQKLEESGQPGLPIDESGPGAAAAPVAPDLCAYCGHDRTVHGGHRHAGKCTAVICDCSVFESAKH